MHPAMVEDLGRKERRSRSGGTLSKTATVSGRLGQTDMLRSFIHIGIEALNGRIRPGWAGLAAGTEAGRDRGAYLGTSFPARKASIRGCSFPA